MAKKFRLGVMGPRIILICASFALATPALATGGFDCSIDDSKLSLETSAALGASLGSPILNLQAVAKTKIKGTPADMAEINLKDSLIHSWMTHPDLNLHFYWEREGDKPHASYNLVIKTKDMGDEISSDGKYELEIFYTEPPADKVEGAYLKAKGKVHCEVE
jgi:hypothetical protein